MSLSEFGRESEQKSMPEIKRLTFDSIKATLPPKRGTDITLQRNGDYIRDAEHTEVGSLTEEARESIRQEARKKFHTMLQEVDENEPVYFLVTGSPTMHHDKGQRALETAEIVREELVRTLDEYHLNPNSLLNNRSKRKGVSPIARAGGPRFVDEMTPYFEYLLNKHDGEMGVGFWDDFESDVYRDERERLGAEGPGEIDDRFTSYIKTLERFAEFFHRKHGDSRLVIWCVSHYDTISPYVKRHVDLSQKDRYLPVDPGGGITLELRNGSTTTHVDGIHYNVI